MVLGRVAWRQRCPAVSTLAWHAHQWFLYGRVFVTRRPRYVSYRPRMRPTSGGNGGRPHGMKAIPLSRGARRVNVDRRVLGVDRRGFADRQNQRNPQRHHRVGPPSAEPPVLLRLRRVRRGRATPHGGEKAAECGRWTELEIIMSPAHSGGRRRRSGRQVTWDDVVATWAAYGPSVAPYI